MKSRLFSTIAAITLMLAAALPAVAAAPTVASLKGTYNFQVFNVKNLYGYYCAPGQSGNCPWHTISNGGCPFTGNNSNVCQNIYVQDMTVGTLLFSGTGGVAFKTMASSNPGDGGPPLNVVYAYKVSGFTASFTITGVTNGGKVCSEPPAQTHALWSHFPSVTSPQQTSPRQPSYSSPTPAM